MVFLAFCCALCWEVSFAHRLVSSPGEDYGPRIPEGEDADEIRKGEARKTLQPPEAEPYPTLSPGRFRHRLDEPISQWTPFLRSHSVSRPHKIVVHYGIECTDFYGLDWSTNTFTAVVVTTLQWHDDQVQFDIPPGTDWVEVDIQQAKREFWLPNIVILDGTKDEPTTSTLSISKTSEAVAVIRRLVKIKANLRPDNFPFDSQTLKISMASKTYSSDIMRLEPMAAAQAAPVKAEVFNGHDVSLVSATLASVDESTGMPCCVQNKKSIGTLTMVVKRDARAYFQELFYPQLLLMLTGWTVFMLPLTAPFHMPRVSIGSVGFLSQVTLSLRVSQMLPAQGSITWMELFDEACIGFVFSASMLNICYMYVQDGLGLTELAKRMQREQLWMYPIFCVADLWLCFMMRNTNRLAVLSSLQDFFLMAYLLGSLISAAVRVRQIQQESEKQEE